MFAAIIPKTPAFFKAKPKRTQIRKSTHVNQSKTYRRE